MIELQYNCDWQACWINNFLRYPRAIMWPKWFDPERESGIWYLWSFYVQWDKTASVGKRGKVNKVRICPEHHEAIIQYQSDELAAEIHEEEVMEQWQRSQENR